MHLSVLTVEAVATPKLTGHRNHLGEWQVSLDGKGGAFVYVTEADAHRFLREWANVVAEIEEREANPPAECDGGSLPSTHEADVMELRRFAATHATDDDPKGAA